MQDSPSLSGDPPDPAAGAARPAFGDRVQALGRLIAAYRTPLALTLLGAAVIIAFALIPSDGSRPSDVRPETGPAGAGFTALPGQASDAPVLAEASEPAEDARAKNAAIPFVEGAVPPAAPFRFVGSGEDRERAIECLALAAMAEAGPSDPGQRAVIQVVLNRVRHPAFARTICGVVYQGSERRTGCQFTFTCDGSLARRYSDDAWRAARGRANEALGGFVYAPVRTATHYHTDWVFPYWSPKLEKLARIETHLFFRWPGYWGSKAAARMVYQGGEPAMDVEPEAAASAEPTETPGAAPTIASAAPPISGGELVMRDASGKANFVLLGTASADEALAMARKLCTDPGTCRVMGWTDRAVIPAKLPVSAAARTGLQFSYSRDPGGAEIALYNCETFSGQPRDKCIPKGALAR